MSEKNRDINYAKVEAYIKQIRPPVEIRSNLDVGFKCEKNTYELFEIRPVWNSKDPIVYQEQSFAKFKYIKSTKIWKLYWLRASGKWESYEPLSESNTVDQILKCIDEDAYGSFLG